jgi:tetratricopeptide (TPR) repeat protein
LLWVVLLAFALLGANGVYLAAVHLLEWWRGTTQQTFFSMLMVILHLVLGVLIVVPFVAFGLIHLMTSWNRPNRSAVRSGLILLTAGLIVLISGFILLRLEVPTSGLTGGRVRAINLEVRNPTIRQVGYWLHVLVPIAAIGMYLRHRMMGPRVKWEYAKVWLGATGAMVLALGVLHSYDPRAERRSSDPSYTYPSMARLAGGKLISEQSLMMDDYCLSCHKDAYESWFHSSHHFSSFNNPPYRFSVRETRKVSMERTGNPRAARWCAGCHDPVPFFSGAFDDPNYDDVNTASSQAGITCTACHAITEVHSPRGNADYTITEPVHYPFAYSKNPFLQWINQTLVKAKPEMHKRTFLKPEVHRDSKFCSTCHKVNLPFALNEYQEFTRGQNHWDPFLLSGVSGGGARSFYYPDVAKTQCAECHMPLTPSNDFAARDFNNDGKREVHSHLFPGANTGLTTIIGKPEVAARHAEYLKDKKTRIDLFAIREGNRVDGRLIAPLRPEAPAVEPGKSYLVEVVVRTLGVGHLFSQGTVDSNEIWVELLVKDGDTIIGHSGGIGSDGAVDPFAHFINVYMLDRHGKRIDRRNPQDIFVPLYNKQIPPGAGQVVHFGLDVPAGTTGPLTVEARLNYRKFDQRYMDYVFGPGKGPTLPVVAMAADGLKLKVAGGPTVENPPSPIKDAWQRWNDYGIGLLLEGAAKGGQKGELRQAEEVFKKVADLGRADGWVNLARVYQREGRIPDALDALAKAAAHKEPAAPWVIAWLTGQVNEANGYLDEAIENYESVLNTKIPARKFDFSQDYEVRNALALALFNRSRLSPADSDDRRQGLEAAVAEWRKTLAIDPENIAAHYGLGLAYEQLAHGADATPASGDEPWMKDDPDALAARIIDLARGHDPAAPDATGQARIAQVVELDQMATRLLGMKRPQWVSRIDPLLAVVQAVGPEYNQALDPTSRRSIARTLAASHKALHRFFRPDETAEGRAVAIARRDNPAANQNAASVVIHPLHPGGVIPDVKMERSPKAPPPDAVYPIRHAEVAARPEHSPQAPTPSAEDLR